jgi:hypothetical protein
MSSFMIVIIVAISSMIAGWILSTIFPSNGPSTDTVDKHSIDRAINYMNNPIVQHLKSQPKLSDPPRSSSDL